MKTQEEIEKLAAIEYWNSNTESRSYIKGYTQCQEDMADKKYTEEDLREAINVGISAEAGVYPDGWSFKLGISLEDYFINSLNKQD